VFLRVKKRASISAHPFIFSTSSKDSYSGTCSSNSIGKKVEHKFSLYNRLSFASNFNSEKGKLGSELP